jgi:hypothetical protein
MRRWSVLLFGAALVLLASIYLPWQTASCGAGCASAPVIGGGGLGKALAATLSIDGWSSEVGGAAAVVALLLAAAAAAARIRPNLVSRLPLGLCALLAGYFGLAVAAQTRSMARQRGAALPTSDFHFAYGAYLGVAAAIVALVVAGAMRRRDLTRVRSRSLLGTVALGLGLLVSFLLPWGTFSLGIATPPGVVAAAVTVCLLASPANRLVLSAVILRFTGAAFSSLNSFHPRAYGSWIGFGLAIGLVAVAVASNRGLPSHEPPRGRALAAVGAAALLLTGLFLPWQQACYEKSADFGPASGRCVSTNGWTTSLGATAALLAIGLLILFVAPRRFLPPATLGGGIALLIATAGFQLENRSADGLHLEFGYGALIGFVAAGLLLALTVVGLRPPKVGLRLAPIDACIAYLVVVVVPWWTVLPHHPESALGFTPPFVGDDRRRAPRRLARAALDRPRLGGRRVARHRPAGNAVAGGPRAHPPTRKRDVGRRDRRARVPGPGGARPARAGGGPGKPPTTGGPARRPAVSRRRERLGEVGGTWRCASQVFTAPALRVA